MRMRRSASGWKIIIRMCIRNVRIIFATCSFKRKGLSLIIILAHVLNVERFCIRYMNKRIVYVLSTLSQLANDVQITKIASNKDGRE